MISDQVGSIVAQNLRDNVGHCQRDSRPRLVHPYGMTLGERIRKRREQMKISRPQLAEMTKIPYSTLAGIENGDQQGSTELHRIASALMCSVEWLASGKNPATTVITIPPASEPAYLRPIVEWDMPSDLDEDRTVFLKKLDYYLSAGSGGPDPSAVEVTDKVTPFRADFCAAEGWNAKTHFTMRCRGESMEPTIQDGAPVVIATNEKTIRSGKVYAIIVDGEPLLKRIDKLPNGRVRVRSDNNAPEYAPFEVDEGLIEVIGRAVWTPVKL